MESCSSATVGDTEAVEAPPPLLLLLNGSLRKCDAKRRTVSKRDRDDD